MGRMPMRAAVSREMTVCSEPVSSTKSISGPRFTFALTMIFSLSTRNGTVCSLPAERRIDLQRRPRAERAQESHFGARPCGFRAAILVGQQVDVARIRVGRLFVALHPLVDRPDRMVELGVARDPCRAPPAPVVERLVQLVARREAARQAVQRAAVIALERQRVLKLLLRFFEQPDRPERVGVDARSIRRCSEISARAAARPRRRARSRPAAARSSRRRSGPRAGCADRSWRLACSKAANASMYRPSENSSLASCSWTSAASGEIADTMGERNVSATATAAAREAA